MGILSPLPFDTWDMISAATEEEEFPKNNIELGIKNVYLWILAKLYRKLNLVYLIKSSLSDSSGYSNFIFE